MIRASRKLAILLLIAVLSTVSCGSSGGALVPNVASSAPAPTIASASVALSTVASTPAIRATAAIQTATAPSAPPQPTVTTQPPPTTPPAPPATTPNLCGAPANPWNYTYCGGSFISAPPANFCSYFNCIATFSNGRGYVIECQDLTLSKSGGISGSCSGHGGNYRPLYAP